MTHPLTRSDGGRRKFLRHLGATLGAAVGLLALSRDSHADTREGDGDIAPQSCAVYCYMINCPCPGQLAMTQFRCISQCGWEQTTCIQRSCVSFCMSQHIC